MQPKNTIDANDRQIGLGYAPDISVIIQPLITETTSPYELHIEIIPVTSLSAGVFPHIEIDGNSRWIGAGVRVSPKIITGLTVDEIVGLPCLRIELV